MEVFNAFCPSFDLDYDTYMASRILPLDNPVCKVFQVRLGDAIGMYFYKEYIHSEMQRKFSEYCYEQWKYRKGVVPNPPKVLKMKKPDGSISYVPIVKDYGDRFDVLIL